jgi:hypothetical protein
MKVSMLASYRGLVLDVDGLVQKAIRIRQNTAGTTKNTKKHEEEEDFANRLAYTPSATQNAPPPSR